MVLLLKLDFVIKPTCSDFLISANLAVIISKCWPTKWWVIMYKIISSLVIHRACSWALIWSSLVLDNRFKLYAHIPLGFLNSCIKTPSLFNIVSFLCLRAASFGSLNIASAGTMSWPHLLHSRQSTNRVVRQCASSPWGSLYSRILDI